MKIELELQLLEDTDMSADDFTALYLVFKKGFDLLERLNLRPDWERLQQEGYIKLGETVEEHVTRQDFIDLFTSNFDSMFAELISTYPMKVSTSRGIRILHAKDPNVKANENAIRLVSIEQGI